MGIMRCCICDYSSYEVGSEFYDSVTHHSPSKKVIHDRMTNRFVCDECLDSIRSTYFELVENDEHHVDENEQ